MDFFYGKTVMKEYKNYIFDFYGTLCDIWTNERKRFVWDNLSKYMNAKGTHYHAGKLQKAYRKECKSLERELSEKHQTSLPEIKLEEVFNRLYENGGVQVNDNVCKDTVLQLRLLSLEKLRLYEGTRELLNKLRNKGKKIYLLSNAQETFTEYEMKQLGIGDFFDDICLSSTAGFRKPSARFFDYLFERNKLLKEESVMIGNDPVTDIKGAIDYGIDSVYFKSNLSAGKEVTGCMMVNSFDKLRELLTEE